MPRLFLCWLAIGTLTLWAGHAHAAAVSSKCVERGPVQGDKVRVCVRIQVLSGPFGPEVWGYGALDHIAGSHANSVRLRVEALHIRAYVPPNGPEVARLISHGAVGYRYVPDWTEEGFLGQCGVGYKAVMTYGIRWSDNSLTRKENFYTPGGTVRWTFPECGASGASEESVGEDNIELEEEEEEPPVEESP